MIKNNVTNKNFLGFIEKQIRKVPLIYFLARFLIRYTNYFEEDFLILKKIFNFKKINIIDIGASDGISAKFFINNLNCNKIICYEPQVTFCSRIEKLKKNDCDIFEPDTSLSGIVLRDSKSADNVIGTDNKVDEKEQYHFYSLMDAETLTLTQHPGDGKNQISIFFSKKGKIG
jgi:hypothetical protein